MLVSFPTDKCPFHLKSFKIPQVNLKKKKKWHRVVRGNRHSYLNSILMRFYYLNKHKSKFLMACEKDLIFSILPTLNNMACVC